MQKLYKFGFWILIIVAFSFFNLWQITKRGYQKDIEYIKNINEKRISSLLVSNTIDERSINSVSGENIITQEKRSNLFQDTSIVILLSTFKCDKCQEKELERLNSLKEIFNGKGIKIIGITTKSKIDVVIKQIKISKIDFPIYWTDDDSFYNNIAFDKEFPQILLIANNMIISGFIPIPQDDEFSKNYLEYITKKYYR